MVRERYSGRRESRFMKNEVINRVQGLRLRLGLAQCQMKAKFNRVEHQAAVKRHKASSS